MAIDEEQFSRVMARLREALPDLAAQLGDEVRHGRMLSKQALLNDSGYRDRYERLDEGKLPRLGDADIGVVPYSAAEKLELLRASLVTLAETMSASRKELLGACAELGIDTVIEFDDPEPTGAPTLVDLSEQTPRTRAVLVEVERLIGDVGQELPQ